MFYLYVKSFHLIFLIAWMVSLLYLPRLFVYHCSISKSNSSYDLFLLMEKRLINIIAIPAMVLTALFGIMLLNIQKELFKFIQSKEFIKYKKITPRNVKDIMKLNEYVRLKLIKKVYKFRDV